jgi:hypothetical protein
LQKKYGNDDQFLTKIKSMMALSYLNSEEIPVYFEELYNELSDDVQKLRNWLKDNYILGKNNWPPSF